MHIHFQEKSDSYEGLLKHILVLYSALNECRTATTRERKKRLFDRVGGDVHAHLHAEANCPREDPESREGA